MRPLLALFGVSCVAAVIASSCAAGDASDDPQDCPIGSETCACTQGGSCDAPLVCLSNLCVNPSTGGSNAGGENAGGQGSGAFNAGGGGGGSMCANGGCKAVDVLFALDGSGSMTQEISALSATQSFQAVTAALAGLNCGDIDYRIGVVDDNTPVFKVPAGWSGGSPWFDSLSMSDDEIAQAFAGAASVVAAGSGTEAGCEHVLTNSEELLTNDTSGFVRPEALLVLVLVTDVDDYGAYDNENGNTCGFGCTVTGPTPDQVNASLVALKGNDPKGVAAIVVAGDPNIAGGNNFCDQPATCGCMDVGGLVDCDVYHATKLWQFAGLQTGQNGFTENLCGGPQTVPDAVQTALGSNIDLACQQFEPPH